MINKINLRKHYLLLRKNLTEEYKKNYQKNILLKITKDKNFLKAKKIGIYYPIDGEINLLELISLYPKKTFYLPKVEDNNLIFLKYDKNTKLSKNKFGILEPENGKITTPDLLFIPGIVFNHQGFRIGYGGGFYDRYLKDKDIIKIGVSYLFTFFNFKEDAHDIKMDYVISNKDDYKRSLIILAAGKGKRLGFQKGTFKVGSKYLFEYSLNSFNDSFYKIIVLPENGFFDISKNPEYTYIIGGNTRTESMLNAKDYLNNSNYTYIHDAARVYLSKNLVNNLIEYEEKKYDAYYPFKQETSALRDNFDNLIDNKNIKIIETPQVIKTSILKETKKELIKKSYRDDIELLKDLKKDIKISSLKTEDINYKITTPSDLSHFYKTFRRNYLVGHSYDIHKISKKRKLYLGGILISNNYGLLAHSDGDVILHAITEAILGTLGMGDLGYNFPDTSLKYKNISSQFFLEKAKNLLNIKKYSIINIDILVYCDVIKLNRYFPMIKENLIKLLNTPNVNLKATTTEKLGDIGKNKAIASEAVILIGDLCDN